MKFDLILFDIDGTLLDFNLTEKNALKKLLKNIILNLIIISMKDIII